MSLVLLQLIQSKFSLDLQGVHGEPHWERVNRRGLELAKTTGANPNVVSLFSMLHDAKREDDNEDPDHGKRGAEFVAHLARYGQLDLDIHDVILLHDAIKYHSDGKLSTDPTIATCWDSDRLDLWRVGTTPAARYLSTDAAKAMLKHEMKQQLQGA